MKYILKFHKNICIIHKYTMKENNQFVKKYENIRVNKRNLKVLKLFKDL